MFARIRVERIALLMAIVAGTALLRGELPPSAYKDRQDAAPEALVIRVRTVSQHEKVEKEWKEIEFAVEAEVVEVKRSATHLAPGALIQIRYSQRHYSQPIAGPSEVPSLKEGQVCPAYLSRQEKSYSPAAGGYSFETVR